MITERKLNAALAKIARWKAGHPHGKPMSGLSTPPKYYFEAKPDFLPPSSLALSPEIWWTLLDSNQ